MQELRSDKRGRTTTKAAYNDKVRKEPVITRQTSPQGATLTLSFELESFRSTGAAVSIAHPFNDAFDDSSIAL